MVRDAISRERALVAVGVVAVAAALLLSGSPETGGAIEQVPAGVDTVVRLDLTITSDRAKQLSAVVNGAPIGLGGSGNGTDAGAAFENETGVDPDPATEVVIFSEQRGSNETGYNGLILHTDEDTDAAVEGVKDTTESGYDQTTYNGRTVHAPANASNRYIGVLGDGELVVGTRAAVRDTIDASAGDGDTLDGALRSAYDNTRNGTVRFATSAPERWVPSESDRVNTEIYRNLDTAGGTYYITGGSAGLELQLGATSTANARTARQATQGVAVILQRDVDNESAAAALDSVNVTQEGETVTVSYEQPLEEFQLAVRYFVREYSG